MGSISLQIPVIGQPASTEDPKIASNFGVIQTAINGELDSTNLSASANIAGSQLAAAAAIVPAQLNLVTWGTTFSTPSLTAGAQRTPNTTRSTMVYATLAFDAATTTMFPKIWDPTGATVIAQLGPINPKTTGEFLASFLVPANHPYSIVNSPGAGTIASLVEQTL